MSNVMNYLTTICRLCIKEHTTLVNIHTTEVGDMKLSGVLTILIPEVDFTEADLPNTICVQCITRMKDAFEFKQMCIKSNTLLRSHKSQTLLGSEHEYSADEGKDDIYLLQPEVNITEIADEIMQYEGPNEDCMLSETQNTCNNASHTCTQCEKSFDSGKNLEAHLRNHRMKKPYECLTCGQRFAKTSYLRDHSRIHTGEKPFKCERCDKSFRYQVDLKRHMQKHEGERPFECAICEKTFMRITVLNNHMKLHTGDRRFICDVCGLGFVQRGVLKNHLKTHSGLKPYTCKGCEKRFLHKFALQRHLKRYDGGRTCTRWDLDATETNAQEPQNTNSLSEAFLKSGICDDVLENKSQFEEPTLEAQVCESSVETQSERKVKHRSKTFKCEVCQLTFYHRTKLNLHLQVHRTEMSLESI